MAFKGRHKGSQPTSPRTDPNVQKVATTITVGLEANANCLEVPKGSFAGCAECAPDQQHRSAKQLQVSMALRLELLQKWGTG